MDESALRFVDPYLSFLQETANPEKAGKQSDVWGRLPGTCLTQEQWNYTQKKEKQENKNNKKLTAKQTILQFALH